MRILLLSCHLYQSKNKAGFHHLAAAFQGLGHPVHFCTCPNSLFSILKELRSGKLRFFQRLFITVCAIFPRAINGVICSSYLSLVHDYANSSCLNAIKSLVFRGGFSRLFSRKYAYDLIIFESGVCLTLLPRLKKRFPAAKLVYRVSDDLFIVGASDLMIRLENQILPLFDLISTPNDSITQRLQDKAPSSKVITQYHGIHKKQLDNAKKQPSPYDVNFRHAVFIGMCDLDWDFIRIASEACPDIHFHLIGPHPKKLLCENVSYHGVIPFDQSLPYLAHCDVALCIGIYGSLRFKSLSEDAREMYLRDANKSLKYIQFTYFNKPIIAPKRMGLNVAHVFSYNLDKESVSRAMSQALAYKLRVSDEGDDWMEICHRLLTELEN